MKRYNHRLMKTCILIAALICTGSFVVAQEATQVKETLKAISKVYDTMEHLRFDVRYIYTTDSVNTRMEGSYSIQESKAAYKLGQMECMQNDSFFIAVYTQDKFILVSKPSGKTFTRFFPVKDAIDSLVKLSAGKYSVSITKGKDEPGKISFRAIDTLEKVSAFYIEYNDKTMLLQLIRYVYTEYGMTEATATTDSRLAKKNKEMQIEFLNNRYELSPPELFDEKKYIRFSNGEWTPSENYNGYKVYYTPVAAGNKNDQ